MCLVAVAVVDVSGGSGCCTLLSNKTASFPKKEELNKQTSSMIFANWNVSTSLYGLQVMACQSDFILSNHHDNYISNNSVITQSTCQLVLSYFIILII